MSFPRLLTSALCIAAAAIGQNAAGQTLRAPLSIPQYFEPNQGQADGGVDFVSRGPGYAVSLRASEVDLQLTSAPHGPGQVKNANVRMKLLAGNIRAHSSAQELQPGMSNYLIGSAHEL